MFLNGGDALSGLGDAIARCQAKTTLKSYWHELRDHQEYRKKIAMKTGTHTQVPVPMTTNTCAFAEIEIPSKRVVRYFFIFISSYFLLISRNSLISPSSVFNFRLPSIASLASMSASRRSAEIFLSVIDAMIITCLRK